jgi:hypothetical protein
MKQEEMKNVVHGENGKNPSVFDFLRSKAEFEYPTEDVKVYASVISKMNLGDLQTHAMDKGIKPSPDRRRLEAVLINQFKTVVAKRKAAKKSRKFTAEQITTMDEQRKKSLERSGFLRTLS